MLQLKDIGIEFGERTLFSNVSLSVSEGDKVGLVGANGSGKTTLFKIIEGEVEPSRGSVYKSNGIKIGYLHQRYLADPQKTVYEEALQAFSELMELEVQIEDIRQKLLLEEDVDNNVKAQNRCMERYEAKGGLTYRNRTRAALLGLGFSPQDLEISAAELSGGQATRLNLCRLLLSNCDLLLLDEPTNHLDIKASAWLEDFLRTSSQTFIVISHDRYFLDKVTNSTYEIENGSVAGYTGSYSEFILKKEAYQRSLHEQALQTDKEIKRLEGIIQQQRQWNRERNIRAAESKQKIIHRLQRDRIAPGEESKKISFQFQRSSRGGKEVLQVAEVGKQYEDALIFKNFHMQLNRGDFCFLIGPNGCGKSTLLKIIAGILEPTWGRSTLGANISLGYYDQNLEFKDETKTVLEEVWEAVPCMEQTQVRTALAAFLFRGDDVFKPIKILSGGEKARVVLLKLMLLAPNLLILDEPTNHLDIQSREALEQALLSYEGTLLIVSHDRYFINQLATKICRMEKDGCKEYTGNYDVYVEKYTPPLEEEEEDKKESMGKKDYWERKEKEAACRKLVSSLESYEKQIEALEKELAIIHQQLELPDTACNFARVMELHEEMEQAAAELDRLYALWAETEHAREAMEAMGNENKP